MWPTEDEETRGQLEAMVCILILGSGGQLGQELMRADWPAPLRPIGLSRAACDVTDAPAMQRMMHLYRPALVVNAAAYTAVDRAETEREAAFRANRDGPAVVGAICAAHGIPMLHISTDYVFDGTKSTEYLETDPVCPLGIYGLSKSEGEKALRAELDQHIILRTAWVFSSYGQNFVKTMVRLGAERDELRVVNDQIGCPTPADALAEAVIAASRAALNGSDVWGTFHYCGDEPVTWYGFATTIMACLRDHTGTAALVTPIPSSDYPTPARRPDNSVLSCSRIAEVFGIARPSWRAGLHRVLRELV
jgi:dTDP-4-dehydrorhamnose reductase